MAFLASFQGLDPGSGVRPRASPAAAQVLPHVRALLSRPSAGVSHARHSGPAHHPPPPPLARLCRDQPGGLGRRPRSGCAQRCVANCCLAWPVGLAARHRGRLAGWSPQRVAAGLDGPAAAAKRCQGLLWRASFCRHCCRRRRLCCRRRSVSRRCCCGGVRQAGCAGAGALVWLALVGGRPRRSGAGRDARTDCPCRRRLAAPSQPVG